MNQTRLEKRTPRAAALHPLPAMRMVKLVSGDVNPLPTHENLAGEQRTFSPTSMAIHAATADGKARPVTSARHAGQRTTHQTLRYEA